MMRLRIDLAYDGTDFHGWAAQPGLRTVEGVLTEWIAQVMRLAEPPHIVVAGRTDAGVHARGQVCHVDADLDGEGVAADLQRRLRRVLPADLVVRSVAPAPEGFDARFSAIWRRYCYRVAPSDTVPDPLLRRHIAPVAHHLDLEALNTAAAALTGLHDFAPFCKPRAGATTIRDLRELRAEQRDDGVVEIHLLADAFCHSMVRSVVGALTSVASGRRDLAWIKRVAAAPTRHGEVLVMPAHGLTLEEVGYPADDALAARARAARAVRTLEDA
ncbi:tRNA pseudouridine(38,39,40) synthase TruA [Tessaracoccus lapidicaptus]|uniref:tRNA pseudouridine synthase A n=1 Tax=Tessaracoccus lapidicaptus TaxID=1427523 RepID=A0A1C0ASU2_9ACTN|nr:tRNA pseudouridine(38-40) synthase TruA [Tessaracoccus lapidicaptus]OCL37235.1 tRNA pseudouridine(38,39,40) synthase TruA [Tessaracoccus lapidicaptus]